MPEHFHVLITPSSSLEKAVQLIKGGFSYRVKKDLGSNAEIWQKGFSDHRIRDAADYDSHIIYIHQNPVERGLVSRADQWLYSSCARIPELDSIPQGLKPNSLAAASGAAEAAPFQIGRVQAKKQTPVRRGEGC